MSLFRTIRFNVYKWTGILGAIAMIGVIMWQVVRTNDEAHTTLGIKSSDDIYVAETKAAMEAWNDWADCEFLVWGGDDILVMSDDGDPCGDPIRPEEEWGHAATAYKCGERWEILVTKPGNTNSTAHYIGHEIGHVLKRPHQTIGFMGKTEDPNNGKQNILKISDADKAAVHKEFCE